ncbi:MAG: hypothetical protein AAF393_16590 [Pseudomonadota bacterium]
MIKWLNKLRRFRRDEGGYSSVELVICASTFLTGFFWVFETGLIMTKQMMLERAVDIVVRDLRLYQSPTFTHDYIKSQICDIAMMLDDCDTNLVLELEVYDQAAGYTKQFSCYDKEHDVTPLTNWEPGLRQEIVYMRACIIIDPMMPNGVALFPNVQASGIPLVADTAFVNEPE